VKALQAQLSTNIPAGYRLCGENLYAEHSIRYESLPSYFLLFSIWDEHNCALSWDDTTQWAELLGLSTVPVLYRGMWDEARVWALTEAMDLRVSEGLVVRRASAFHFDEFGQAVAKWVRRNHVTTDEHWLSRPVRPNGIREMP
jgi:hypothetical protein